MGDPIHEFNIDRVLRLVACGLYIAVLMGLIVGGLIAAAMTGTSL